MIMFYPNIYLSFTSAIMTIETILYSSKKNSVFEALKDFIGPLQIHFKYVKIL